MLGHNLNDTELDLEFCLGQDQVTELDLELLLGQNQVTELDLEFCLGQNQVTELDLEFCLGQDQVTELDLEFCLGQDQVTELDLEFCLGQNQACEEDGMHQRWNLTQCRNKAVPPGGVRFGSMIRAVWSPSVPVSCDTFSKCHMLPQRQVTSSAASVALCWFGPEPSFTELQRRNTVYFLYCHSTQTWNIDSVYMMQNSCVIIQNMSAEQNMCPVYELCHRCTRMFYCFCAECWCVSTISYPYILYYINIMAKQTLSTELYF